MNKRFISIFIAIVLVLPMLVCLAIPVSADSLYIRKIVSVVYDDSGSMSGDKWAYANYAMQAFCGMLNSEDQLFITYMSHSQASGNYTPEKVDLSSSGIQDSVYSIQNHTKSGSTPYKAVEIAYNKLKSVNDTNANTQYWLVVITDGNFDESYSMSASENKKFLNDNFKRYTESVMPNGTNPQVTFLGIGGVIFPDEDHSQGIFTYAASSANDIISTMSDMSDRISGRTRLQTNSIKKIDDKTIRVSSSIPLLNIVVFSQGSKAKITKATYESGKNIPLDREVYLEYSGYSGLVGGAFLLGDSKNVIGSGAYNIVFDKTVDLDDIIILFEPALEMRMTLEVNGKKISDHSELNNVMESDKISVSCKIYEMGTDKEIDPSLLPPNTKFEITVLENKKVVEQSSGEEMLLSDYVLKNIDTEIKASVIIDGFNPIDYSAKFTPTKYVPRVVYTIQPSFGSSVESVKFDNIANNEDMTVCFTVYADGVAITDPEAVKALNPVINTSPTGNDGKITYSKDGTIIFTPKSACEPIGNSEAQFEVDVKCTLEDGTSATESYTVLKTVYTVSAMFENDVKSVKFDEIANNKKLAICFVVYADGVAVTDPETVKSLNPVISFSSQGNDGTVRYSNDGKIIFTPNAASVSTTNEGSFNVEVECTIDGGASAKEIYTVLLSTYEIIPINVNGKIKKNEFFDNQVSVSFYITKDGVRLGKEDVEKQISVLLNEEHAGLKTKVSVEQDGTIIITPYIEEQHTVTFANWWINWIYYWGLESEDVTVTLSHAFGTASSTIDVVEADTKYVLVNVLLPLFIEVLTLALIIAYLVRYFTKARFASNGALYVGTIIRNTSPAGTHSMSLVEVRLGQYNKFKNLCNPFKELTVSVNGVSITAAKDNMIICNDPFPWYSDGVVSKSRTIQINSPVDIVNYCQEKEELIIREIKTVSVMDEQNRLISQDYSVYYFTQVETGYVKVGAKQNEVIENAVVFCYSTI